MSDIGFQRRHYLDYFLHGQPGDGRGSTNVQVRIILASLGQGGHCVGSHPHEELFGSFGAHLLHQVVSDTIEVYKRYLQLTSHVAWRVQISPVGINQSGTCFHFCLRYIGINTLTNIILNNSLRYGIGIGFARTGIAPLARASSTKRFRLASKVVPGSVWRFSSGFSSLCPNWMNT